MWIFFSWLQNLSIFNFLVKRGADGLGPEVDEGRAIDADESGKLRGAIRELVHHHHHQHHQNHYPTQPTTLSPSTFPSPLNPLPLPPIHPPKSSNLLLFICLRGCQLQPSPPLVCKGQLLFIPILQRGNAPFVIESNICKATFLGSFG